MFASIKQILIRVFKTKHLFNNDLHEENVLMNRCINNKRGEKTSPQKKKNQNAFVSAWFTRQIRAPKHRERVVLWSKKSKMSNGRSEQIKNPFYPVQVQGPSLPSRGAPSRLARVPDQNCHALTLPQLWLYPGRVETQLFISSALLPHTNCPEWLD